MQKKLRVWNRKKKGGLILFAWVSETVGYNMITFTNPAIQILWCSQISGNLFWILWKWKSGQSFYSTTEVLERLYDIAEKVKMLPSEMSPLK